MINAAVVIIGPNDLFYLVKFLMNLNIFYLIWEKFVRISIIVRSF